MPTAFEVEWLELRSCLHSTTMSEPVMTCKPGKGWMRLSTWVPKGMPRRALTYSVSEWEGRKKEGERGSITDSN